MLCPRHHWRTQGVCKWLCLVTIASIRESTKHAERSTSLVTDGTCVVRGDCLSSSTGPGASVCPYWTCPVNRTTPITYQLLPVQQIIASLFHLISLRSHLHFIYEIKFYEQITAQNIALYIELYPIFYNINKVLFF